MNGKVEVTVLGSRDAFASGGRRQSAYLVSAPSATFLMDAGPTVLAALKDARRAADDVDFILLSHLHGDHFAGIPFLFLEYLYERPRERELVIAGPAGTEERVRGLFEVLYKETAARPLPFAVRYVTLVAGRRESFGSVVVDPFAVPHQQHEPSLGLSVRVDGRTILYSGDSGWTDEFVKRSEGVDLFLCECCFWDTRAEVHIDYPDLARHRPRLRAKRVVLSHLGREVLEKLDRVDLECADDGLVLEV